MVWKNFLYTTTVLILTMRDTQHQLLAFRERTQSAAAMILTKVAGSLKGKTNTSILVRDWIACEVKIDDKLVSAFAQVTGDVNPIHLDPLAGRQSRFGQRVAHGLLSASLFPTLFSLALPGAVYIYQDLKFDHPIYYNDTIRALIEVEQIRAIRKDDVDECLLMCKTTVFKDNEVKAIVGKAKVLI